MEMGRPRPLPLPVTEALHCGNENQKEYLFPRQHRNGMKSSRFVHVSTALATHLKKKFRRFCVLATGKIRRFWVLATGVGHLACYLNMPFLSCSHLPVAAIQLLSTLRQRGASLARPWRHFLRSCAPSTHTKQRL
jgi:hypothetical protein